MPNKFPDWIRTGRENPATGTIRILPLRDVMASKFTYRCDVRLKELNEVHQLHWDFDELMDSAAITDRINGYLRTMYPDGYELVPWKIVEMPKSAREFVKLL